MASTGEATVFQVQPATGSTIPWPMKTAVPATPESSACQVGTTATPVAVPPTRPTRPPVTRKVVSKMPSMVAQGYARMEPKTRRRVQAAALSM
jgi:hypothetical protein